MPVPLLVTGSHGFSGRHLTSLLEQTGHGQVLAPSRTELDLCDAAAVRRAVAEARPAAIVHLAAFSSPTESWERPADALLPNVAMTLNLLEAVRRETPATTLVIVGSGQVYGTPATAVVDENSPPAPESPYALSKATGETLAHQYAEAFGLRAVALRPFNHAGPGQSDAYVVSAIARQVAEAELSGLDEATVLTGDPDCARDFTDVRDIVRAYLLATRLDGGTYNICSGRSTSIATLIEIADHVAEIPVRNKIDPARLRANDLRTMSGSAERFATATGWRPAIPLERTIADTLAWWRTRLRENARATS